MECGSINLNVSQVKSKGFVAKNSTGTEFLVEACPHLGGSGTVPSPLEYFIAALGTCPAIKIRILLSTMGNVCESIAVDIKGTRRPTPPEIFEVIHLTFTLSGILNEQKVTETIKEVMTLHCPIAVMVSKAVNVTWEHRIL